MSRFLSAMAGRFVIAVPYIWLLFFFLVPFVIVFKISLSDLAISMPPYTPALDGVRDFFARIGEFDFENFKLLMCDMLGYIGVGEGLCRSGFAADFYDRPYLSVAYLSSIKIAFVSTILTLLVGYPLAYGMARAPQSMRTMLLMLVILPFWTSFLIRVYAWIGILKPEGLLNQFLFALGLIDNPLIIMNTTTAVYIGIVYSYLPFMVLPLYANLEKMDYSLIEAAQDLGCTPLSAFWKITFPLSLPGIVAGCLLVFIPAVGEFVIPDLLGGSRTLMIGKTLWSEFFNNRDWPLSSAVAIILLLILVVPIMLFQRAQAMAQEAGR